jgi:hypothetical protein
LNGYALNLGDNSQTQLGIGSKCSPDVFPLNGCDISASVAQYQPNVRETGLSRNLRSSPHSEVIAMLSEEFAY